MGLASRATGRGVTSTGALASLFRVALLFFGIWDVQTQTVTNTRPTYIWQT
ncbi:thrombospondin type-1 domain-containing protein 7A, partial [Pimephales promelas]